MLATLRGHFRPEFLNRVDDIVIFNHLRQEDIERIVTDVISQTTFTTTADC